MARPAPTLAPAARTYRGSMTRPDRWATWEPHEGDLLVCTPSKSGTTWTQTILAMLVHGGPDLPAKLPALSPWVDADLGVSASDVAESLAAQTGRRVVKTHTPADGFPIWEGVTVIAVYRHPLDVFFSLRKQAANKANPGENNPFLRPVSEAFDAYINSPSDINDSDRDNLASLATHYVQTVLSHRLHDLRLFHYSNMVQDERRTVQAMAKAAGIDVGDTVIRAVTEAASFGAMKAKARDYAPVGGTGFFKSDEDFFDSASSRKWEGTLSIEELERYRERLAALIPDVRARAWLENGN
jgi:aryl sulfotransferase